MIWEQTHFLTVKSPWSSHNLDFQATFLASSKFFDSVKTGDPTVRKTKKKKTLLKGLQLKSPDCYGLDTGPHKLIHIIHQAFG